MCLIRNSFTRINVYHAFNDSRPYSCIKFKSGNVNGGDHFEKLRCRCEHNIEINLVYVCVCVCVRACACVCVRAWTGLISPRIRSMARSYEHGNEITVP
jgi:hypothetical protein